MIRHAHGAIPFGLLLLLAPGAVPASLASVLVVDRSGAGQFSEIQAAVIAAQDGDTILVRVPTSGGPFQAVDVAGKALTIAADSDTLFAGVRGLRVHDLPAGKTVVLTRLQANPQAIGTPPGNPSIWLDHNAGSVRLVSCVSTGMYSYASPGLAIESSSGAVAMANSTLAGGNGADGDESDGQPGGTGLRVLDGIAAAYDSSIAGGAGGALFFGEVAGPGGPGATVSRNLLATRLMTENVLVQGGRGGDDLDCFNLPDVGGAGGTGLALGAGATLTLLDTILEGGAGGSATCGPSGSPGAPLQSSGTVLSLAGPHLSLITPTVAREGQTITLAFAGAPGDQVFLLVGRRTIFQDLWGGALIVQPEPSLGTSAPRVPVGTIGPDGVLDMPYTLPAVSAARGALNLWLQGYSEHADGTRTLGSFSVVTVLDSAF